MFRRGELAGDAVHMSKPDSHRFALESVDVASTPLERFEEFLQSRGKRATQQKRLLVQHIFSRHAHFDADELIDELSRGPHRRKISRPTVYRVLGELVDAGLLRKMVLRGRAVYEHDYGYPQHDHLHCQECDKLIEFHSSELSDLFERVASEYDFRPRGHRLIVTGTCSDCASKRRRKRPVDLI